MLNNHNRCIALAAWCLSDKLKQSSVLSPTFGGLNAQLDSVWYDPPETNWMESEAVSNT